MKNYLKENPTISLFQLFSKDPKILNSIAPEVSIKSAIASLLCDEVERKKGIEGIKELIMCGRGDVVFFETLNKLVAISQTNFDFNPNMMFFTRDDDLLVRRSREE